MCVYDVQMNFVSSKMKKKKKDLHMHSTSDEPKPLRSTQIKQNYTAGNQEQFLTAELNGRKVSQTFHHPPFLHTDRHTHTHTE